MGLASVIAEHGIELRLEGERLLVGSAQPLTEEQRNFILANKQRLIEELRQQLDIDLPLPFLQHAADLDLSLLWDDRVFVDQLLAFRSINDRHQLLAEYRNQWLAAAAAPDLKEYQRENAGRKAANTWLRTRLH
ncbi:hypothetical protein [Marinobacterium aestuariivivens]|uniref:TubC N-terminal docking domain-containing protein n=1 Tax=Marinobacterium aestuariivivens TaxID=1698799 RepID=A0ABW1ZZ77_9GAMM